MPFALSLSKIDKKMVRSWR